MNKVTTLPTKGAGKAVAARVQTRELLTELLEPERQRIRWTAEWQGWMKRNGNLLPEEAWKSPEKYRETATHWTETLPSMASIYSTRDLFSEARWNPCSEKEVDLLLALMVDGFPNARPKSMAGYLDALALVIGEYNVKTSKYCDFRDKASKHAVAAAIKDIWSEMDFAPSPKEFLDKCKEAASRFGKGASLCSQLDECRCRAESVLIVLGELQHLSEYVDPEEDEDFAVELREQYAEHLAQVEQERLKREAAEQERKAEEERRRAKEERQKARALCPSISDRVRHNLLGFGTLVAVRERRFIVVFDNDPGREREIFGFRNAPCPYLTRVLPGDDGYPTAGSGAAPVAERESAHD